MRRNPAGQSGSIGEFAFAMRCATSLLMNWPSTRPYVAHRAAYRQTPTHAVAPFHRPRRSRTAPQRHRTAFGLDLLPQTGRHGSVRWPVEAARNPSRSLVAPASAATAASTRCADKDPWVKSTMTRAIFIGIELRINLLEPVRHERWEQTRRRIRAQQQVTRWS